jgi:MFS family permease
MNWNDYEGVWKRQELPVGADADVATLRTTLETKRRKLYATLLVRDLTEAVAGIVVAVAYAYFWWKVGKSGWPLSLAIVLILGVSGFFVRERFRTRRLRLSAKAPLLAKVDADIAELRHQRRLLLNIWSWYLAPCAAAMAIQGAVIFRRPVWDSNRNPFVLAGFGVFFALIFWFVWTINRRAVRKQIEPRLAELEKLRHDLLSLS